MISGSPQILNDLYLNNGDDLQLVSPKGGDLLLANSSTRCNQRVVRRLTTNPLDYIWQPSYGAGLAGFVGQPLTSDDYGQDVTSDNVDNIRSIITSQIFLENCVSQTPPPQIFLNTIQFGLFCQINYTESPSLQPIVLTFDIGI